jgi:hypothetical protein
MDDTEFAMVRDPKEVGCNENVQLPYGNESENSKASGSLNLNRNAYFLVIGPR